MRKALFSTLCLASSLSSAFVEANTLISNADDITYEWLTDAGNPNSYADHVPHFNKLFKEHKVRTLFEFGVGFETKYFLDSCDKVISVEFVTNGYGPEWIKSCLNLYQNFSNWVPIVYFTGYQDSMKWAPYKYAGSDSVYTATSYQCATHRNYALVDDFYLKELNSFISRLAKSNRIDVAFVHPPINLRGDLVQLLFDKVPIILANGTSTTRNTPNDVYGYSRIKTPDNYEEISLPNGHGTTIWIEKKDQFQSLTKAMKMYAEELQR
jgi:hypothetical protein